MAASPARERSASAGLLSIGQVLARLTPDFPDLTSSKLRFLEVQGIVTPSRTESGYRKFSQADIERLRLGLTLQRDHYLPLSVIREQLDEASTESAALTPPPSITPTPRRYRRTELLSAAGAGPQLLNDAISTGVITAQETYPEATVALLRGLVALDRHGIEPRHLRALRQGADREVALIESALSALLRRTDAASRAKASELAPELASKIDEVRGLFVKEALTRVLS
ncbi:MerR family transcriptional regulator [Microbacterium sp. kSW2-24]|jgi:DNA-binding transcriptional MerR regulator|uniref:transcriptional regulator FtsR n=1 Tax=Microbacterium TaxID=33882 RepID=UPI001FFCD8EC|nr:MerR family transcriptional regulator [Microbacterium galbinum]MCK2021341.1 MerR family transcriptional regulator [Microbacterium galbinum]MCK2028151.1 MerR family transcriptional regulator [Microbacterium galbinum]